MPLNNLTKQYFDKNKFNKMTKKLNFINVSRGLVVNENDLYEALKNKKIFGAGVDVFEKEPPIKNHKLFSLSNTLLTPHNAALTLECRKRMSVESCENVFDFLTKSKNLNKNNIINLNIIS